MVDFNFSELMAEFDPCELISIVYSSDSGSLTELGRYTFRGYAKGINRFFQICSLLGQEVAHSYRSHNTDFENFASMLRSSYYPDVKRGEVDSIESALQKRIDELKQYKFKARELFYVIDDKYLKFKEFEITVDHIFKWILKRRQRHIIFYERVLQEYRARKDQYNQFLQTSLERKASFPDKERDRFSVDSVLTELGIEFNENNREVLPKRYYEISSQSWYIEDLLKLGNPEIERYQGLSRYRTGTIYTHQEGLKVFFEIFFIFRDEMNFVLPDEPNKSFFEKVLTLLQRDFHEKFEQQGDLEDVIVKYIEQLEKYEFLSLSKNQFFDKLSKTIYSLRARRIAFYEAMLQDYLANKEKYDKKMLEYY